MVAYNHMEIDMTTIVRNRSTGKYHLGATNSIWCNYSGQRRIPSMAKAQLGEVEKAGDHMFCAKCFNGKPTAADIAKFICQ
jgi:hypothetical protein